MSFEKPSYTVRKNSQPPRLVLILSEQLQTDVAIEVVDREGTATSKSTMFIQHLCKIKGS